MRWASVHQCKWRGTKGQKNEMNWLYWCGQINRWSKNFKHFKDGFAQFVCTLPAAPGPRGTALPACWGRSAADASQCLWSPKAFVARNNLKMNLDYLIRGAVERPHQPDPQPPHGGGGTRGNDVF
uniref:Uncharacterized protein n=1 Tax=Globodera rostochiensis TaxID=31243 RepID=A0A914H3E7_GLORO